MTEQGCDGAYFGVYRYVTILPGVGNYPVQHQRRCYQMPSGDVVCGKTSALRDGLATILVKQDLQCQACPNRAAHPRG